MPGFTTEYFYMKAVILEETRCIAVREVPDAEIREDTDVLLRITSTAICGTDLHFYEGRMRGIEGGVIGHEPLGVVEEVGSAVKSVKKGDRVVVPTHICCGFCAMCEGGHSSACLTANPGNAGAAYGYPNKGGYQGAQAELLRVPLADANCLQLPGEPGDMWEDDLCCSLMPSPRLIMLPPSLTLRRLTPSQSLAQVQSDCLRPIPRAFGARRGFTWWMPSPSDSIWPASLAPFPSTFSRVTLSSRSGAAGRSARRPGVPSGETARWRSLCH